MRTSRPNRVPTPAIPPRHCLTGNLSDATGHRTHMIGNAERGRIVIGHEPDRDPGFAAHNRNIPRLNACQFTPGIRRSR